MKNVRSMRRSSATSDYFLVRTKDKFRISIERIKRIKYTKKISQTKKYKGKIKEYLVVLDYDMDIN